MKYKEAETYAADLHAIADWIGENGHKLPRGTPAKMSLVDCWLTASDYKQDEETGEWGSVIDEDKTKDNLRRFLEGIGSCNKDYNDDRLIITKDFGSVRIKGTVDRSLTCKKVVTGTKVVPSYYQKERTVEEVEWVCDEGVSLLELVKE